jgi:hypothetical protein
MEECLHIVEEAGICETDKAFAIQIRLQLVLEKAMQAHLEAEDCEVDDSSAAKIPPSLYLHPYRSQLADLRKKYWSYLTQDREPHLIQANACKVV